MGVDVAELIGHVKVDTSEFSRGMDEVKRSAQGAEQGLKGLTIGGVAVGTALGNMATGALKAVGGGLLNLGKEGIKATAELENLEVGMSSLIAREMAANSGTEKRIAVGKRMVAAQEEHYVANVKTKKSVEDLTFAIKQEEIDVTRARMALEKTLAGHKKGKEVIPATADEIAVAQFNLEKATRNLEKAQAAVKLVPATAGGAVTVYKTIKEGVKSISEVMPEAQKEAKKMMDEMARIAILSPYQLEAVASVNKVAQAFGFSYKESLQFTKGMLNTAAGVGATNDMLQRMAYNFAQIRLQGKVTAVDVRQLALAGFDLNSVLKFMGEKYGIVIKDHKDFNAALSSGKIKWENFTADFAEYADKNFGGASERMSRTLKGLVSTFKDVVALTMPTLLKGFLGHFTEFANGALNAFLKIRESGLLEKIGDGLSKFGEKVFGGLTRGMEGFGKFFDTFNKYMADGVKPLEAFFLAIGSGGGKLQSTMYTIVGTITKFREVLEATGSPLQAFATVMQNFIPPSVRPLIEAFVSNLMNIPKAFETIKSQLAQGDIGGVAETIKGFLVGAAQRAVTAMGEVLKNLPQTLAGILPPGAIAIFDPIITYFSEFPTRVNTAIANVKAGIGGENGGIITAIFGDPVGSLTKLSSNLSQGVLNLGAELTKNMPKPNAEALMGLFEDIAKIPTKIGSAVTALSQGRIGDAITTFVGDDPGGPIRKVTEGIAETLRGLPETLKKILPPDMVKVLDPFINGLANIATAIGGGLANMPTFQTTLASLAPVVQQIADSFGKLFTDLGPSFEKFTSWLAVVIPQAAGTLKGVVDTVLVPILTTVGTFIAEKVIPALGDIAKWLMENIPVAVQSAATFFDTTLKPALEGIGNFISTVVGPAVEGLIKLFGEGFQTNSGIIEDIFGRIQNSFQVVSDFINTNVVPAFDTISQWFNTVIVPAVGVAVDAFNMTLLPILQELWKFVDQSIIPLFKALDEMFTAIVGVAVKALASLFQDKLIPPMKSIWEWLQQNIIPAFAEVVRVIKDVVLPLAKPFIEDFLGGLRSTLESIGGFISGLIQKIKDFTEAIKGIGQAPQGSNPLGFLDGIFNPGGQGTQNIIGTPPPSESGGVGEISPKGGKVKGALNNVSSSMTAPSDKIGGVIHVHLEADTKEIASFVVDRLTGEVYRESLRYS